MNPVAAKPAPDGHLRCGLVTRAERTWVGFVEGMTLDDMVPAGVAAGAVVHALDVALCGVVRRGDLAPGGGLDAYGPQLKAAAKDGGGFEVSKVFWDDPALTRARVELHAKRAPSATTWLAAFVRRDEAWKITDFGLKPRDREDD